MQSFQVIVRGARSGGQTIWCECRKIDKNVDLFYLHRSMDAKIRLPLKCFVHGFNEISHSVYDDLLI